MERSVWISPISSLRLFTTDGYENYLIWQYSSTHNPIYKRVPCFQTKHTSVFVSARWLVHGVQATQIKSHKMNLPLPPLKICAKVLTRGGLARSPFTIQCAIRGFILIEWRWIISCKLVDKMVAKINSYFGKSPSNFQANVRTLNSIQWINHNAIQIICICWLWFTVEKFQIKSSPQTISRFFTHFQKKTQTKISPSLWPNCAVKNNLIIDNNSLKPRISYSK